MIDMKKYMMNYNGEHGGYSSWFLWGGLLDIEPETLAYNTTADLPFILCPGNECFVRADFLQFFSTFTLLPVESIPYSGDLRFERNVLEDYFDELPTGDPYEIIGVLVEKNRAPAALYNYFYIEENGHENDYLACDNFDVMFPIEKLKAVLDEYMYKTNNVFWPYVEWEAV